MIRVVLAEDHTLVREALAKLLIRSKKVEIVGLAADGAEAITLTKRHRPDVLVLDLSMPGGGGLEVLAHLMQFHLPTKFLVLTMHDEATHGARIMRSGATGFLHKSASLDDLLAAIEGVARGDLVASKDVLAVLAGRALAPATAVLSPREFQVMGYLAAGEKNRDIAAMLGLSVKTIDTHRGHILRKLRLRNNADLTRFAIEHDLMPV